MPLPSRTLLVLSAVATLVPAWAAAQPTVALQAGMNSSKLTNQGSAASSRRGLNLGVSLAVPESGSTDWMIGVAYTQKGFDVSGQGASVGISLDYLELTGLLRRTFDLEGPAGIRVLLGSALGVEVGCSLGASSQGVSVSAGCVEADIDPVSVDLGIVGGAGFVWARSGSVSFVADLLYNHGLVSVQAGTEEMNRAFSLRAGIEIPVGGS